MILGIIIRDTGESLGSNFKGQVRLPAFSFLQLQEMGLKSQRHWTTKGSPLKKRTAPANLWDTPAELFTWPEMPWHNPGVHILIGATECYLGLVHRLSISLREETQTQSFQMFGIHATCIRITSWMILGLWAHPRPARSIH